MINSPNRSGRSFVAVTMLIGCALTWGSNVVVGRAFHEEISPIGFSFWRNTVGLLALAPFTARKLVAARRSLRQHVGVVLVAGLIGTALFNVLFYWGVHTTTAISAGILIALSPVIIPALALPVLRERMRGRELVGIFVSLLGVVLMVTRGNPLAVSQIQIQEGEILVLLAALCWATYSVVVKLRPPNIDPLTFLTAILIVTVIALAPFYLWELAEVQPNPSTVVSVAAVVYVGVFPTAVALSMFNLAVDRIGPIRAGLYTHLVPVFSTGLAILFLGEKLEWFQIAGALPIAVGLYLTTTAKMP